MKCVLRRSNDDYGPEIVRDSIEVKTKSFTETEGEVNPATEFVPLCSDCHSMVHRKRGEIIPVDILKDMIQRQTNRDRP